MPLNMGNPLNQQPPVFPQIDQIGETIHPVTKWALAGLGSVGGLFYGLTHHAFIPVCVILGFLVGLLAIPLLLLFTKGLLGLAIVAAVAIAAFYLFKMSMPGEVFAPVPAAAPSHHARPPRSDDPLSTAFAAAFQSVRQAVNQ